MLHFYCPVHPIFAIVCEWDQIFFLIKELNFKR